MRVLFITSLTEASTPRHPLRSPEQIQFGISYLSAQLKRHGHDTRLAVLSSTWGHYNRRILDPILHDFDPRLIAFTAVSSEFPFMAAIARRLEKVFPAGYRVLGGPHATLQPEEAIAAPFHAICVGEGEEALVLLARQLEAGEWPSHIGNLWMNQADGVERQPPAPFLEDLDALPYPDREMWTPWIVPDSRGRHAVLLGRGCPYQCTYCANHALSRAAPGRYVRLRNPEAIVAEIRTLVTTLEQRSTPPDDMALEVESIGLDQAWALELCQRLEAFNAGRARHVGFATNYRVLPRTDPSPLFRAMRAAGFRRVTIGLESGSDRVRREVMQRRYSTQDILDTIQCARRHGLQVILQNIIGVPGETEAAAIETALLHQVLRPQRHYVGIFHPYPGTRLHAECARRGLAIEGLRGGRERHVPVIDLPEFPAHRVRRTFVLFDLMALEGRVPLRRIAPRVLKAWVRTHPRLDLVARRLRARLPFHRAAGLFRGRRRRFRAPRRGSSDREDG